MDDPYGIRPHHGSGTRELLSTAGTRPRGDPPDRATGALWVAFAVFVGLNAVSSIARPDNVLFSLVFGIPTILCLAALVARYLRRRRP
ncbi:hypothetical protein HCA61_07740 [Rhodococcus sp. HNM0563]|uniref:hypothetical protein n=1 Tax=unclassified Rhodococcus (in: high G+C Gram-positive bacteria) TaxID=192944 RepID=UPI00146ED7AC|nr:MULTISPECIES: hypothetical protein [unclassified Rhodococcus (in: high G+C Gram-positive bacteria)]MCK0089895.1 hypothetical protein [Rhodococcus sp. F64268]NLU62156.1 hypothetical protein [Rhodococcus sp. HNM0563]